MLETPHVVVGAAIATKIGNPALAIPLAFLSHFVLDQIPHWNPHFYTETKKFGTPKRNSTVFAVAEELLAFGVGLFIASRFLPDYGRVATILAASFAAVASDQVKFPYFFFKWRYAALERWVKFERTLQVETSIVPGMLIQIVITLAGLYFALSK